MGVGAPPARAADRRRLPRPIPIFRVAGMGRAGFARAAVGDLRARSAARRGRLVDGGIRPRWKGRSLGVPSGDAPRARLPDLYGDGVDRGGSRSAGADRCAPPAARERSRSRRARLGTDISRRAAGRAARRADLSDLAADRWRADTEHRCDAYLTAVVAKPVRERTD